MDTHNHRENGKLIIALGRAMQRSHGKSIAMLRENGLTFPQFTALEALYHKGALTVSQIIDAALSTSGNMTVVIRNLEQRGLVLRMENPSDKRSFLIGLTAAGRELIEFVFPLHMELLEERLSPLSVQEKETIIQLLKRIR